VGRRLPNDLNRRFKVVLFLTVYEKLKVGKNSSVNLNSEGGLAYIMVLGYPGSSVRKGEQALK
jgi:hypothetical protein